MTEKQNIQKVNSEFRTVAAEELERAIASELESMDNMTEVDLSTLLFASEDDDDTAQR